MMANLGAELEGWVLPHPYAPELQGPFRSIAMMTRRGTHSSPTIHCRGHGRGCGRCVGEVPARGGLERGRLSPRWSGTAS